MSKILIADDHPLFRSGLKQFLLSELKDVSIDEASNGQEALEAIEQEKYEALVLDIIMPDLGGLEVLDRLKTTHPDLPVLVISMHDEKHYAAQAIKAGASAYLVKDGDPRELAKALRITIDGGKYISNHVMEELLANPGSSSSEPQHNILSNRELQILKLIASGKKLTTIAEELSLSVSAVSTHRTRILSKMAFENNADIVRYAVKAELID